MTAIYRPLTKFVNFHRFLSKYDRMVSSTSSGSTFDGRMITSDYQKCGNYFQRDDNQDILKEYKSKLNWSNEKPERILDIGCGPGDVTNDILLPVVKEYAKDFTIVGSDIDANVIEQAKSTYPSIEFDVLDIGSPLSSNWTIANSKPLVKIEINVCLCKTEDIHFNIR